MKQIKLQKVEHNFKIGDEPSDYEPTLFEDSLFIDGEEPIGFYLSRLPEKIQKLIDIANAELNSDRVPKSSMRRSSGLRDKSQEVSQYSCIIGNIPPKPVMRRNYANKSSVHSVKSARTFIKAMTLARLESLDLIKKTCSEIYQIHKEAVEKKVPEQWRFAELFTSSISNCNISARIHQDRSNVVGALNVIITKRLNARGGNLYIPDYDLTVNSADNSMLVYPAWRNMHGVTPIIPTHSGGYRNSLIFYALDRFPKEQVLSHE